MSLFLKEELSIAGHNLVVKERIAEGGFGFVDLVVNPQTGQEFVLKRCGIQRQEIFDIVNKEITLLRRFRDRHIVQLIASETAQNAGKREAYLLLEYCPGGHLLAKLNARSGNPLPLSEICRIFSQLLDAVLPMHESSPPVIHRDLKLENILFSQEGLVKLCDFGSCATGSTYLRSAEERSKAEEIISKETTQMYRAPEMVDLYMREELTEKTDIWALGCILYCLCFISHPFQDAGNLGILSAKLNFPRSSTIPDDMNTLITRLLDLDPEARPNILEIKAAIKAISQGDPLPPYELSEIAQQKKEERRLSQIRRTNQNQKKAAPLPTRDAVPLAANSVAARRLAAKRNGAGAAGGDVIGSIPHPGYATATSSSSGETADFFFDDSKPIAAAPVAAAATSSTAHDLDFFGTTPAAPAPAPAASNDFFDAFSTPAASTTATKTSSQRSAPPPAATAAAAAPVDLFGSGDLFSTQQQPHQAAASQPSKNSSSSFDAFGGSNSLLTEFTTAPPPTIEEKAKNVLNLFDAHPPPGQGQGRPQQVDPYAAFAPSVPGYGQPRPMGPPAAGMYGGGGMPSAAPMYGGPAAPMYGGGMPPAGIPSMVRQQQPPRPQNLDPFGSLGGFDAFKK